MIIQAGGDMNMLKALKFSCDEARLFLRRAMVYVLIVSLVSPHGLMAQDGYFHIVEEDTHASYVRRSLGELRKFALSEEELAAFRSREALDLDEGGGLGSLKVFESPEGNMVIRGRGHVYLEGLSVEKNLDVITTGTVYFGDDVCVGGSTTVKAGDIEVKAWNPTGSLTLDAARILRVKGILQGQSQITLTGLEGVVLAADVSACGALTVTSKGKIFQGGALFSKEDITFSGEGIVEGALTTQGQLHFEGPRLNIDKDGVVIAEGGAVVTTPFLINRGQLSVLGAGLKGKIGEFLNGEGGKFSVQGITTVEAEAYTDRGETEASNVFLLKARHILYGKQHVSHLNTAIILGSESVAVEKGAIFRLGGKTYFLDIKSEGDLSYGGRVVRETQSHFAERGEIPQESLEGLDLEQQVHFFRTKMFHVPQFSLTAGKDLKCHDARFKSQEGSISLRAEGIVEVKNAKVETKAPYYLTLQGRKVILSYAHILGRYVISAMGNENPYQELPRRFVDSVSQKSPRIVPWEAAQHRFEMPSLTADARVAWEKALEAESREEEAISQIIEGMRQKDLEVAEKAKTAAKKVMEAAEKAWGKAEIAFEKAYEKAEEAWRMEASGPQSAPQIKMTEKLEKELDKKRVIVNDAETKQLEARKAFEVAEETVAAAKRNLQEQRDFLLREGRAIHKVTYQYPGKKPDVRVYVTQDPSSFPEHRDGERDAAKGAHRIFKSSDVLLKKTDKKIALPDLEADVIIDHCTFKNTEDEESAFSEESSSAPAEDTIRDRRDPEYYSLEVRPEETPWNYFERSDATLPSWEEWKDAAEKNASRARRRDELVWRLFFPFSRERILKEIEDSRTVIQVKPYEDDAPLPENGDSVLRGRSISLTNNRFEGTVQVRGDSVTGEQNANQGRMSLVGRGIRLDEWTIAGELHTQGNHTEFGVIRGDSLFSLGKFIGIWEKMDLSQGLGIHTEILRLGVCVLSAKTLFLNVVEEFIDDPASISIAKQALVLSAERTDRLRGHYKAGTAATVRLRNMSLENLIARFKAPHVAAELREADTLLKKHLRIPYPLYLFAKSFRNRGKLLSEGDIKAFLWDEMRNGRLMEIRGAGCFHAEKKMVTGTIKAEDKLSLSTKGTVHITGIVEGRETDVFGKVGVKANRPVIRVYDAHGYTDQLGPYVMASAREGDLSVISEGDVHGRNAIFRAKLGFVGMRANRIWLRSQQLTHHHAEAGKKHASQVTEVIHHKTHIEGGKGVRIQAVDSSSASTETLLHMEGLVIKSEGETETTSEGKLIQRVVHNTREEHHSSTSKKGSSSTQSSTSTALRNRIAGKTGASMISKGANHQQAPHIVTEGVARIISEKDKVYLYGAKSSYHRTEDTQRRRGSSLTFTHTHQHDTQTDLGHISAPGGIEIWGGEGVVAERVMGRAAPAHLKGLLDRPDVQWRHVRDIHEHWSHSQTIRTGKKSWLKPEVALVVTLAISIAASPVAGAFVASLGATGTCGLMASTALTSLAASASTSLMANRGNLKDTWHDMASKENLRALAATVATAGVLDSLPGGMLPAVPVDFLDYAQIAGLQSGVSTAAQLAFQGGNVKEALKDAALLTAVNAAGGYASGKIGDKKPELGPVGHITSHAVVGAASGFALSHGTLKGAVSGAIGAAGAEMVAEALSTSWFVNSNTSSAANENGTDSGAVTSSGVTARSSGKDPAAAAVAYEPSLPRPMMPARGEIAKLAAVMASVALSLDANITLVTGDNAVRYNDGGFHPSWDFETEKRHAEIAANAGEATETLLAILGGGLHEGADWISAVDLRPSLVRNSETYQTLHQIDILLQNKKLLQIGGPYQPLIYASGLPIYQLLRDPQLPHKVIDSCVPATLGELTLFAAGGGIVKGGFALAKPIVGPFARAIVAKTEAALGRVEAVVARFGQVGRAATGVSSVAPPSSQARRFMEALDLEVGLARESVAKKKLLPGEGKVGTYGELDRKIDKRGDNLSAHHMPHNHYMESRGVQKKDGISMTVEEPVPGLGGRHREIHRTLKKQNIGLSPRDALAESVRKTRQVYTESGLGDEIRPSLIELVEKNKKFFPELFKKEGL